MYGIHFEWGGGCMAAKNIEEAVEVMAQHLLEGQDIIELVDVEYVKEHTDWYLRVYIDKEGGIDIEDCQELSEKLEAELDEKNIAYKKDIQVGIMVETAAASLIADIFAKEADFFSIGTNDLTQYTLAIDRQNAKLDRFYDSHHPAVLKMIQMVIDSAHEEGIWAGICGELGADLTLTETFVKMGIDELSVSPAMVLPVRNKIINA